MRAWQISSFGIDSLEFVEKPTPQPGPGEVLVAMHAISLNYRDLMVVKGKYNPQMKLPRIPCSDGAGVVVDVGEGVTSWKAGDRVMGIFMQNWLGGGADRGQGQRRAGRRHGRHAGRPRRPERERPGFDSGAPELSGGGHAALCGGYGMECAGGRRSQAGCDGVGPGHGRRLDFRAAVCPAAGTAGAGYLLAATRNWSGPRRWGSTPG